MAVSEDTRPVGGKARVMKGGMVGGLGRVKERAPGGDLGEEVMAAGGCGMGWSASRR
jgi:hypothetical protein